MNRSTTTCRNGAAVVELAVSLPIIFLIVFGSIAAANILFLRQAMVQASYEGVKCAIRTGDPQAMQAAIDTVAQNRRLTGMTVETTPSDIRSAAKGDFITVKVGVPSDANSLIPFSLFQGKQVEAQAVMARE